MTTIDDVSTNDMNIKHLDTTKNIVITPKDEFGNSVQLNASHTWTAKVSDGTNYVGDYQVTLESTSIVVKSSDFTKLPAGNYHLEVWEEWIDSNNEKQRSIYPSPRRTVDFNIYQNITDLAEKEIKTIGFQDVVDQAVMNIGMNYVFKVNTIEPDQTATVVQAAADGKNYVTFNIPKGDKGDKGDVGPAPTLKIGTVTKLNSDQTPTASVSGDNGAYTLDLGIPQGVQGETDATATQALNIANSVDSKVTEIQSNGGGRNLAIGTADKKCNWPRSSADGGQVSLDTWNSLRGQWVTISCDMNWTGFTRNTRNNNRIGYEVALTCSDGTQVHINNWYYPTDSEVNKSFRFSRSWQIPDKEITSLDEGWIYNQIDATTCVTSELMIERGTVAHDWSPAPEDAPSNDAQLVHKTGNETIAGDKAFVGNTALATTTILEGNYGLRVTSSGIQKTTDGKTWVPANF